jgi:putative Mg2+ transporter-C (MgtC) family protein
LQWVLLSNFTRFTVVNHIGTSCLCAWRGARAGVIGIIAEHGAPNVLAGAITGIGFIGVGLVFRQAFGSQQVVLGITTAAAIFAAAAIGAAAGQGRLLVAVVATALSLLVLEIRHVRWLRVLDGQR